MIYARCLDDDYQPRQLNVGPSNHHNHAAIPNDTAEVQVFDRLAVEDELENDYADEDTCGIPMDCKALTHLLKNSSKKLRRATLNYTDELSPEYLGLLITLFKQTESINIFDFEGDAGFTCLMSSLLQNDGPRTLELGEFSQAVSLHQAKLLFEGIALSTTLENLELRCDFDAPVEVGPTMLEAMRRNSGLKRLVTPMNFFHEARSLAEFFNVTCLDTEVKCFEIYGRFLVMGDVQNEIPFEIISDALCQEGCSLKQLHLSNIRPSRRNPGAEMEENAKNSSIANFTLYNCQLDCPGIMDTVGLFQSIVKLSVNTDHPQVGLLSDLSALDPLLIGDNLTLKSLSLQGNNISVEDAIVFFRKLPKMRYLEHIDFGYNPFVRNVDSWKNIAIDAIRQNKSLECIRLGDGWMHSMNGFITETRVPLSLNRGGRRALEAGESPPLVSVNLWPKVLERATKLVYCNYPEDEDEIVYCFSATPVESTRVDVVFWMLREKILGQCL